MTPRFTAGISSIVDIYCTVHPVLGTAPTAISTGIRDICAFSLRKISSMDRLYMYHIPLSHPYTGWSWAANPAFWAQNEEINASPVILPGMLIPSLNHISV